MPAKPPFFSSIIKNSPRSLFASWVGLGMVGFLLSLGLTSQAHGQLTYDDDTGIKNAQDVIGAVWYSASYNWLN